MPYQNLDQFVPCFHNWKKHWFRETHTILPRLGNSINAMDISYSDTSELYKSTFTSAYLTIFISLPSSVRRPFETPAPSARNISLLQQIRNTPFTCIECVVPLAAGWRSTYRATIRLRRSRRSLRDVSARFIRTPIHTYSQQPNHGEKDLNGVCLGHAQQDESAPKSS